LKQKCKSRKAEVGAKNERAKQELEGMLPPFSWFFFVVVFLCVLIFLCLRKTNYHCLLLCIWAEEEENNVVAFFFMSEKKMTVWQHTVVFFCGGFPMKKAMPTYCHRLSFVVLKFNLVVFGCL
jgi:hypothetical protein